MSRKKVLNVVLIVLVSVFLFSLESNAEKIKIDGNCREWGNIVPTAKDTVGDIESDSIVDFVDFWVIRDGDGIYFSYSCEKPMDWNTDAYRYNIFIDVDNSVDTGYRGWKNEWSVGADYLLQGGTVFKFSGTDPKAWAWEKIGLQAYSVDGNQAEVYVPLDLLGVERGQKIGLLLYGDNGEMDIDYVPDEYTAKKIVVK